MSAFIVSKAHIDHLVAAGLRCHLARRDTLRWWVRRPELAGVTDLHDYGAALAEVTRELTPATASRVGAMLWGENMRSVDARYSEANDREVYEYRHDDRRNLDPVVVLKLIDCYEYQSCETGEEWDASEAHAYCEALRRAMIRRLPGYETAPWGL